jgi:MGT family glycosyltransferase
MRILMVLWDGGGNVPPQLAIARELVRRGHDVRVLGHRVQGPRVEATGAEFSAYERAPDADASRPETDLIRDWEARTPLGAFAKTRDNLMFGPAMGFASDVIAELEEHPADVATFDYLLVGAATGIERAGVPAVALIHTIYPLPAAGVPPFGMGLMPARGALGRMRDAVLARAFDRAWTPGLKAANAARTELGLEPYRRYSEPFDRADLALVLTSPEFDFAGQAELPGNVRYAGPVLDPAVGDGWDSPWPADRGDPLVLASFSTTYQDQRDLARRVMEAIGDLPVRGLLTTGPAVDVSGLPVPDNVEVREFVPHAPVLREASLVVSHAGLGTVHAALAAGVPLVCLPYGRDQDDNAARVVHAGAGVKLRRGASTRRLRRAIAAALDDHSLTEGAQAMAEAFRGAGAAHAADEIEAVAAAELQTAT